MNDTICALASGAVEAGIGIIRVSGDDAVRNVSRIFKSKNGKSIDISETHRVKYGYIYDHDTMLDEVLVITMLSPRSYTGEDTVEIDCHGGIYVMKRILELVEHSGCRLAEPGEFTKRAFLNGRIDLSEAEAVSDLITAENETAVKSSVEQLKGSLSEKLKEMRATILEDDAHIEAALDDPEHIELDGFSDELACHVKYIIDELDRFIDSYHDGRIVKDGINTVIVGKPNAGKSSFLNALLDEDRAIVTNIAGTTRDILKERVNIQDITFNLYDTAGIHETSDEVENIGIKRAIDAVEKADLILYVVDGSKTLDDADREIMAQIHGKTVICIYNKADLQSIADINLLKDTFKYFIEVSALHREGMDAFYQCVSSMFYQQKLKSDHGLMITNLRQKEHLEQARNYLRNVLISIENGVSEDFYTVDLMGAYTELGYILGENVSDDLINEIFSKFCMGK